MITYVFSRSRLIVLVAVTLILLAVYALLPASVTTQLESSGMEEQSSAHSPSEERPLVTAEPQAKGSSHEIQPGDTLSGIFAERSFDPATLNAVLAADEELLALDVLRPGNTLYFEHTESIGELVMLALNVHPGRTIYYRRAADGIFEFEEDIKPAQWHEQVVSAYIRGSFYASASSAGVSDADILHVQRIFEERVDFRRDIKVGDWFEIVFGREMVDNDPTGQTRIEAIRLHLGRQTLSAFLHNDGNYYDARGESLSRAFLRYPMQGSHRVSSPFNLRRLHPITQRIAPHHGVDFAMPTGTPILSIGDGVVTRIGNHPYAGKYIEIRHAGQFKTRYLHLSHVQVKQGQQTARGDRVALSGNTGRSTGPHLHFELHINDRPVDPLTANIPTASSVPPEEMALFTQRVKTLVTAMRNETLVALRKASEDQGREL